MVLGMPSGPGACQCEYFCGCACMGLHLKDCVLAGRSFVQTDAAVARPSASLVNITTAAAHWPSCTITAWPFPAISELGLKSFPGPRHREAAVWGSDIREWVVNILKCSRTWVYFTPVICYTQRIGFGCGTEDYCTYKNYFITIICSCSFCEAVTFHT